MGTLRLWCERISSEANRKLFTREQRTRYYCQHNMNALMRGNSESQSKWLTSIFQMGGYSVNEVLQEVGLNPIGLDGEKRFVTLGMDALGRIVVVVYTWRRDRVRMISARKATPNERLRYTEAP